MNKDNLRKHMDKMREIFGPYKHKALDLLNDVPCYPEEEIRELVKISRKIMWEHENPQTEKLIQEFERIRKNIKKLDNAPERIYLWPKEKMPKMTEYTDNSLLYYDYDPEYEPYMFEILISEDLIPKGAVLVIPGGAHGDCTINEGWQVCKDLNKQGYQCFLLHNRINGQPWSGKESGADVARAIRYVRANSEKYRVKENNVALVGFSNGGLTGDSCIQYYSGKQSVKKHFPEYEPDELDEYYGAPDVFICIYGPRFKEVNFDYTEVQYPPTFMAIGRNDLAAIRNFPFHYMSLVEHQIPVEVHSFSGAGHGIGGISILDENAVNPNFELWILLADSFMQDVYEKTNVNYDNKG